MKYEASSLLGYSKDEAMGQGLVQRFITEDYKASVDEVLASALMGRETANFEFPMFTKLGERLRMVTEWNRKAAEASGYNVK